LSHEKATKVGEAEGNHGGTTGRDGGGWKKLLGGDGIAGHSITKLPVL
jgi:hypothetical protein